MDQLIAEAKKLTNAKIAEVKDDMAAGLLTSMDEYKRLAGMIVGLRHAMDLLDEAYKHVSKR